MYKKSNFIVKSAVIGAFYAVLTLVLGPISFGTLGFEIRISEALTILPVFLVAAVPGLFVGCIISNLIGMAFSGLGIIDVVFGSLATLVAAILSYWLRNIKFKSLPVLSFIPPVLINAIIIGAELSIIMPKEFSFIYAFYSIGVGELLTVFVLGIPLYYIIKKINLFDKF